jgi:hypothetical protein
MNDVDAKPVGRIGLPAKKGTDVESSEGEMSDPKFFY